MKLQLSQYRKLNLLRMLQILRNWGIQSWFLKFLFSLWLWRICSLIVISATKLALLKRVWHNNCSETYSQERWSFESIKFSNDCSQWLHWKNLPPPARTSSRTCPGTFFDLEDAFGSFPHSLIMETLKINHLPDNICDYFSRLNSSSCQAVVRNPTWRSEQFSFRRGVFQGDPLGSTIFSMVFNPVLMHLKNMEDKVQLCGNRGTTNHYLNCCKVLLNTDRYTWRHNNIVNFIVSNIDSKYKVPILVCQY